jgi:hypothetical protein
LAVRLRPGALKLSMTCGWTAWLRLQRATPFAFCRQRRERVRRRREDVMVRTRERHSAAVATRTFKRCPTCCGPDEKLPAEAFYRSASRSDGLSSQCRECHHAVQRRYHARNAKAERSRTRRRKRRLRDQNRASVLQYLQTHPCVDCGESDPVVLEFHHVRGEKHDAVACMLRDHEWWRIAEEIDKCTVLCANCHRRLTGSEQGHYRSARRGQVGGVQQECDGPNGHYPTVKQPPSM